MALSNRRHWSRHIDQIHRSHHYTWLGEGLGGESPERAITVMLADLRHLCDREGISWDRVVEQSDSLYLQEELALSS